MNSQKIVHTLELRKTSNYKVPYWCNHFFISYKMYCSNMYNGLDLDDTM